MIQSQASTAVVKSDSGPSLSLRGYLGRDGVKSAIANALPQHMTAERMIRVALTSVHKVPKLQECTMESVYAALLDAAQLGLEPNGRDAYLIPFRNNKKGVTECQLMPGYQGLVQLAYRSGMINNFTAMAVYEKDVFEYELGSDEHIKHIPSEDDNPGPLVAAWAMVRFKDGGSKFVVLKPRDVKRRMASSKSARFSDSPWKTHPEEMWAKSAAKALCKWIPQSAEMQRFRDAVDHDDAVDGINTINMEPEPLPVSKSDSLADQLSPPSDESSVEVAVSTSPASFIDRINTAATIGEVNKIVAESQDSGLDEDGVNTVDLTATIRREQIREARGSRTNGNSGLAPPEQSEMFETHPNAQEA